MAGWVDEVRWRVGGTRLEFPLRRLGQIVLRRQLHPSRGFEYDRLTVAVMRRVLKTSDLAVDVGAHDGALLRWMVRFAPEARHIAIEPLPEHARRLRERFPTVDVRGVAVSDHEGSARFNHVRSRPAVSSLSVRSGIGDADVVAFDVEVTTIDALVASGPPVRFIKIDVEGAEHQVLLGARSTILRDRPCIAFEHGPGAHGGVTIADVHRLLTGELGLRVSLLDAWLSGQPSMSEAEMVDAQQRLKHFFFLAHP